MKLHTDYVHAAYLANLVRFDKFVRMAIHFKAAAIKTNISLVMILTVVVIVILGSRIWLRAARVEVRLTEAGMKSSGATQLKIYTALLGDIYTSTASRGTAKLSSIEVSSKTQASIRSSIELSNKSNHSYTLKTSHSTKTTDLSLTASPGTSVSKPKICRKRHCEEHLSKRELLAMKSCLQDTVRRTVNGNLSLIKSVIKESKCNFMDGSRRRPVALASAEGSGNTWIRGLLEKTTGTCTGFLYCDFMMRKEGFIGEMIKSGSVLVVKTHTVVPQWYGIDYVHPKRDEPYYSSAVFIVRNPYNALIAEWNRRATNGILIKKHLPHNESHTNVVPREYWGIPQWDKFLHKYMEMWKLRLVNWVLTSTTEHPVHVVRYEDLKKNTFGEIAKILSFLGIPYKDEELLLRLKGDFIAFKRQHDSDNFQHYSSIQTQHIKSVLLDMIVLVQSANKTLKESLKLKEYLPYFDITV